MFLQESRYIYIPKNLKAALRWVRCVSATHLHITEQSGRPKIDSCAILQGFQRSKTERICALQWMLLKPGAVLLCSRMPTGMFQLQSDLSSKGDELFSQYPGSFSMDFDRESQLIKSYFVIKCGSISLFEDYNAIGFFLPTGFSSEFSLLFLLIVLPVEEAFIHPH